MPHAGPRSLAKLLDAVIALSTELDLASVLQGIVEAGVDLIGARYGALGVLDERRTGLAEFITVGMDEETRRLIGPQPKGLGLLGTVVSDARPLRVADLNEHPERYGFPENHPPMSSFLGVPIRVRGEVFGNLYLTNKQAGEVFTDVDEELMLGLASAAGTAIENARLFGELERREAAISATHQVTRLVLEGADPEETLRVIARRARVLANADVASFALPDHDSEILVMAVVDGELGSEFAGVQFPRSGTVSGDVLGSGRVVVLADLASDHRRAQPQVAAGTVGPAVFVALNHGGRALGTLFVGRERGALPFADADVEMIRSFASQAEIALDAATHREERERFSLVEEKQRIARDLHDTAIQQAFGVGLTLQNLASIERDPMVRAKLAGAVEDLDGVIRQIRTAIFAIAPAPVSVATSLRREVMEIAAEVSRLLGFDPTLRFDGPVDSSVDEGASQSAAATVREILSNVVRHAQASQVEVTVRVDGRQLVVRVVDDGIGLPSDQDAGGRGLRNIRSRAEQNGGHLELLPGADGRGTTVEWVILLG